MFFYVLTWKHLLMYVTKQVSFMHKPIHYYVTFVTSNNVKCMLFRSFCTNMYCSQLWFNSTSSSIKKLKTSYNGELRRLLLIKKQCL